MPVVQAPPSPSTSNVGAPGGGGGSSGGGGSGSSGSTSSCGGSTSAASDKDISTSVSIKNGSATYNGEVSYPDDDSADTVYIRPTGFDSVKTSGNLIFTLTCSGGTDKVKYNGGSVKSGSPGCNKTWIVFFTNDSSNGNLQIYLDSPGYVNWTLVITASG